MPSRECLLSRQPDRAVQSQALSSRRWIGWLYGQLVSPVLAQMRSQWLSLRYYQPTPRRLLGSRIGRLSTGLVGTVAMSLRTGTPWR
ncbi:hypothetical protein DK389_22190 [Methylobacterium durans]|uniref:Uncharacterized protein n=1 Tax=Methylobacterium durans TaxID=2202825 RepID=A0A2U8WAS7_9HYPH|nr:hypothetical protein DK389_22190 [Methylobacterium durans]